MNLIGLDLNSLFHNLYIVALFNIFLTGLKLLVEWLIPKTQIKQNKLHQFLTKSLKIASIGIDVFSANREHK